MNKKFLTLFAIVALLVAAMAGTAFAASDDILELWSSPYTDIGALSGDYSVTPLEYEATAYYLEGSAVENGFYLELYVSMDKVQDAVSFDVVFDGDYDLPYFGHRTPVISNDWNWLDLEVSSWDVVPESFKLDIGAINVSGDRVGASVDLTVTTQAVSFFDESEFLVDHYFISDDIVVKDFGNYAFYGGLALSSDKVAFAATSVDVISDEFGRVMVTFDDTTGTIHVDQVGYPTPGATANLYLYAPIWLAVSADNYADVAGYDPNEPIATLTITVDDPLGDLFERLGTASNDLHDGANFIYGLDGGYLVNSMDYEYHVVSGEVFGFEVWFLEEDANGNLILDYDYDGEILSGDLYDGYYGGDKEAGEVWDGTDFILSQPQTVVKGHVEFEFYENEFQTLGIRGETEEVDKGYYHIAVYDNAKILAVDPIDLYSTYTREKHRSSGDGIGCDAGFGAFALLGLAGLAAILRKKD